MALQRERKYTGGTRCSELLTLESLLVARVYKVFLFKSKWLQTSLAASGPWVTMAAIRFRQARAILHRDEKIRHVRNSRNTKPVTLLVVWSAVPKPEKGRKETCFKNKKTQLDKISK